MHWAACFDNPGKIGRIVEQGLMMAGRKTGMLSCRSRE
jgi:hypothetical protein